MQPILALVLKEILPILVEQLQEHEPAIQAAILKLVGNTLKNVSEHIEANISKAININD